VLEASKRRKQQGVRTEQSTDMRNLFSNTFAVGIGGTLLGVLSASAAPIGTTTYGGNTYELFASPGISWSAAESDAVTDGGTLAVLTTAAQTTAVYDAFIGTGFFTTAGSQATEAWLGARPADGSSSTTNPNNWAWVTGAAWTTFDKSNFDPGEPNGDSEGLAINRIGTSQWNDEGGPVGGYIVEIPLGSAVPDTGSNLLLLGSALGSLGMIRRKLQK
jgi:hypothetical protein